MEKSLYTKEYKIFLKLLYEVRAERGIRQIDLAQRLNVHQSFVSKYECGERRLDIIETRKICKCIGIDFELFISRLESLINDSK